MADTALGGSGARHDEHEVLLHQAIIQNTNDSVQGQTNSAGVGGGVSTYCSSVGNAHQQTGVAGDVVLIDRLFHPSIVLVRILDGDTVVSTDDTIDVSCCKLKIYVLIEDALAKLNGEIGNCYHFCSLYEVL